jgi:hypothetical protein
MGEHKKPDPPLSEGEGPPGEGDHQVPPPPPPSGTHQKPK